MDSSIQKLFRQIWNTMMSSEVSSRVSASATWLVHSGFDLEEYASTLGADSNFSLRLHQNWILNDVWQRRSDPQNHQAVFDMLISFMRDDLKELLKVPNSAPCAPNNKSLLLGDFIAFLVRITPTGVLDSIISKLRFLVPIFGFIALQATEQHQAHTLLAQFESVSNRAGTIVHSSVFSPDPVIEPIDSAIAALVQGIDSLQGNIITFLDSMPYALITPRAHFFIPAYVVYYLDCLQSNEVKGPTQMLQWHLNYQQPLANKYLDEEMKEDVIRVSDVAYEVKSLLKYSLAGKAPRLFLIIRLTHLNDKIKNARILKRRSCMDSAWLAEILDSIFGRILHGEIFNRLPLVSFSMAWSQFFVIREYTSSLGVNSDFSLQMHKKWRGNEVWQGRFEPENHQTIYEMLVGFLRDDLKELFKVPKSYHSNVNKSEVIAAFIGFLLQILHQCKDFAFINISHAMMMELRYLVVILGDTPFKAPEHQTLESLLAECEDVANKAGSTMHSAFFRPDTVLAQMDGVIATLLRQIDSLKPKIIEFMESLQNTVAILGPNSFFTVDSLANDLEDYLQLCPNVEDQLTIFYEKLKPYRSKNGGVEEVAMQIREVVYQAEYLINNFLVGDAPHWYLTTRLTHLIDRIQNVRIDHQNLKKEFDVGVVEVSEVSSAQSSHEVPSNTIRSDSYMPVFENQKKEILDQLFMGTEELERIFIVGMGGVGKTTFAKQLYNHPVVGRHFDRRLWCTVSQIPDWKNIFISILIGLEEDANSTMAEETLILKVYQGLKSRRFLIVVDDVWCSDDLEYLQRWLPDDQNGSRILLTSRNGDIAPSGSVICKFDPWSEDQCLELIFKKACLNDKPRPRGLEEMGKKMATKCFGLPLAAAVMAGMLLTEGIEASSSEIVNDSSDYYEQFGESTSIMNVLELSYKSLPPYLKPCFLYCAIFREDEKIHTKKLKRLWIAQGFIPKEENERVENTAEQYLKLLIDRNLLTVIEKRSTDGAKVCTIHDLLRELCLKIAKKQNFLTWMQSDHSIYNQKYHHICVSDPMAVGTSLEPFGRCFRSLFVFCGQCESPLDLCNAKLLRALQLNGHEDNDLIRIKLLFHLRYLAIVRVPISIHTIAKNLEFLLVKEDFVLTPEILKMLKLRLLFVPGYHLVKFGEGCEAVESSNLEFLSTLEIRDKKDQEILRNLPHLHRLKCYVYTLTIQDFALDFEFLTQCESLSLMAGPGPFLFWQIDIKLPSTIKKLNLRTTGCSWENMSVIGALPNLEVLKLEQDAFRGELWKTGNDEFQRLSYLKMESLDLTQWIIDSNRPFPRLQHLVLKGCPRLKEIPSEIGEVASLCVMKVQGRCRSSLIKSAKKIQEEQQEWGDNDQLKVIMSDIDEIKHPLEPSYSSSSTNESGPAIPEVSDHTESDGD